VSELSVHGASGPLPADVRQAGTEAQRTYRAAESFERMLLGELTKTMSAPLSGDEEATAATSTYRQMLPGTLADAVTGAGGLGLARTLYDAMREDA
jgi:Rod binding domain-containing protein